MPARSAKEKAKNNAGMAASKPADKGAGRHPYGPRPLAALLPALTKATFRRRSPLAQRLMVDWETIVGPAVAAVTVPVRCAGGVLTIFCSGPIALELQHFAPKLIERINRHFGRVLVKRLMFRHVPPVLPQAPARPAAQVDEAALQASVAGLAEGPLRKALLQLGRAMGSGTASGRGGSISSPSPPSGADGLPSRSPGSPLRKAQWEPADGHPRGRGEVGDPRQAPD